MLGPLTRADQKRLAEALTRLSLHMDEGGE